MRAGRLDTLVSIRAKVSTNNSGVDVATYPSSTARGTEWAEVRGLSARERFQSQQLDAEVDYQFRFYSTPVTRAISPTDRLLVGSTTGSPRWFDLAGSFDPNTFGTRREVIVLARERHA